jgi:thiamine biosynthesis lipoprotein
MKQQRLMMGMPIMMEVVDKNVTAANIEAVFDYFHHIDEKFSTYKETSEVSRINKGELKPGDYSDEMKKILDLSEKTRLETNGYFNIKNRNGIDPSGLVKGWAIFNAAKILEKSGYKKYFIEAGGDIQTSGKKWKIGIRNPFNRKENVKIIEINGEGVATSGTYIRGQHVYNPFDPDKEITEVISITVIGPNIYEADRMATAALAMGKKGIEFIQKLDKFAGYMIDHEGVATYTNNFEKYVDKT